MMHPALLIKRRHRLRTHRLAPRGPYRPKAHIRAPGVDIRCYKIPAVVDFPYDPVSSPAAIGRDGDSSPSQGRFLAAKIIQDNDMVRSSERRNHDTRFIGILPC